MKWTLTEVDTVLNRKEKVRIIFRNIKNNNILLANWARIGLRVCRKIRQFLRTISPHTDMIESFFQLAKSWAGETIQVVKKDIGFFLHHS